MLEEKIKNGEQPEIQDVHTVATDENKGLEDVSGSPLGKFKDGESLLNAYNELQSEFTRKCQKLSETEKKLQENILSENVHKKDEDKEEFAWKNTFSDFLQSHKTAENFVEEITSEIVNDENLKNSPDGLEQAYLRVLEKNYIPKNDLAENPEFLEKFIYSNENIKNKIINEYISDLQKFQSPINVNNMGSTGGIATNTNFTSLADATKYVESMFTF